MPDIRPEELNILARVQAMPGEVTAREIQQHGEDIEHIRYRLRSLNESGFISAEERDGGYTIPTKYWSVTPLGDSMLNHLEDKVDEDKSLEDRVEELEKIVEEQGELIDAAHRQLYAMGDVIGVMQNLMEGEGVDVEAALKEAAERQQ
ncbi:winged-helix domain-containing protein [Natrialbaceae archaeon A-CW1-1]